jgi:hypothetical protein
VQDNQWQTLLDQDPFELSTRLAYGDWLEENGCDVEARVQRLIADPGQGRRCLTRDHHYSPYLFAVLDHFDVPQDFHRQVIPCTHADHKWTLYGFRFRSRREAEHALVRSLRGQQAYYLWYVANAALVLREVWQDAGQAYAYHLQEGYRTEYLITTTPLLPGTTFTLPWHTRQVSKWSLQAERAPGWVEGQPEMRTGQEEAWSA